MKEFTISDNPGSGYQALLLDSEGNTIVTFQNGMYSDFRDIRFKDGDGTTIPYYIESYSSGVSAQVWVKLTSSNIIIMLWGTESTSGSDPESVFDFWDDFDTFSTEKWTVVSGSAIAVDSVCQLGSTTLNSMIKSVQTFDVGHEIEVNIYHPNANESYKGFWDPSTNKRAVWKPGTSNPYNDYTITHNGTTGTSTSDGVNRAGAYHIYEVLYESGKCSFLVDNELREEMTATVPSGALPIGFYSTVNAGNVLIDWVRVRKVVSTEPVFTLSPKNTSGFFKVF